MIASDSRPVSFDLDTAVTVLKELAEQGQCSAPIYDDCGPDALGYDQNGNPKWSVGCRIVNSNTGIDQLVQASSKKDAKKAAAYLVLCDHFEVQNQYRPNRICPVWIYHNGHLVPDTLSYNEH